MGQLAKVEAIIFMSEKPISLEKIAKLLEGTSPEEILNDIKELQQKYLDPSHGLILMEIANGYQFRTKSEHAELIKQMAKNRTLQLTPGMLEVLAIIAYKGPISRIEIDKTRGVDSSYMLRSLMDRKLIKIAGRSDDLGRPTIYTTTQEFLEFFNLNTLNDLPSEQELQDLAKSKRDISEIKELINNENAFIFDEYEEILNLSQSLKEIKADTSFTKELRLHQNEATGFDILEKHLILKQLKEENALSIKSELIVPPQEVTTLKSLHAFNNVELVTTIIEPDPLLTASPE